MPGFSKYKKCWISKRKAPSSGFLKRFVRLETEWWRREVKVKYLWFLASLMELRSMYTTYAFFPSVFLARKPTKIQPVSLSRIYMGFMESERVGSNNVSQMIVIIKTSCIFQIQPFWNFIFWRILLSNQSAHIAHILLLHLFLFSFYFCTRNSHGYFGFPINTYLF